MRARSTGNGPGSDPGMACEVYVSAPPASSMTVTAGQRAQQKVPGERTREVMLDPGASAGTPVRNQGPGRSLPGPDAGHPLQATGPIAPDGLRRVDSNGDSNSSDRRQRITLARSAPTGDMSGLKTDGRGSTPFDRDCSQDCSQATGRRPTYVDTSGIPAQPTTGDGRSWTTCPLLRIRCLVPAACPKDGQTREPTVNPGRPGAPGSHAEAGHH